ncbi:LysR family transcriptional regulator [Ruegeria sp. SCSIO 43209]|nr:LysR family transcriptional regulator [Ruegeria sp. SCSIO 43209]
MFDGMMNKNSLTAFLTLAEIGSFQNAARAMGVSNASLSRYVGRPRTIRGLFCFIEAETTAL